MLQEMTQIVRFDNSRIATGCVRPFKPDLFLRPPLFFPGPFSVRIFFRALVTSSVYRENSSLSLEHVGGAKRGEWSQHRCLRELTQDHST